MKILFNTYYYAFQNPGGGEVVLKKLRDALIAKGIQVDLFDQWNTQLSDYDIIHEFSTVNYRNWDGYKKYCHKLVVTPVLWPDVSFDKILNEKIKAEIKNLLGYRSSEVNLWNALRKVDRYFPTTQMEMERIAKRYALDLNKFTVAYNGVDKPLEVSSTNKFCEKYNIDDYFLFVGRITPVKNIERIIGAAREVDKKIVIVGKADQLDKSYERALIEKYQNDSSVLFVGPLEHDGILLSDAYHGARAVVIASIFETCSLVGLEAGVRGVPLIITSEGATREVYQDYVRYVNPYDVKDIADKILQPWTDSEKLNLKNHVSQNFVWESIASNIINAYAEIIKN